MKKVYLILMLVMVTVFGHGQAKRFTLIVSSSVQPYTVFVNNKQINGNRVTLAEGKYQITVKSSGYVDYVTTINLNRNYVLNAKLQRIVPKITTATVEIRIPSHMINSNTMNPLSQIRIYDNGKPINGLTFKALQGDHTIVVETGGLRFESYHNFIAGRKYTLEPVAYLNMIQ